MVRISQKRTTDIPPVKIDNDLLFKIGNILKEECPKDGTVEVSINSDSMDIGIENVEELKGLEIPADTYKILMVLDHVIHPADEDIPEISIAIDTKSPRKESKIRVNGQNATRVKGVSERLCEKFNENRLSYRYIAKYENLRLLLGMATSALLSYVTGFALWYFTQNLNSVVFFVAGFFYAFSMLLKRAYDWLFPYFEIDNKNFKPKRIRKWALAILWGSGLIPTVIFRLLGL
jgi:hypothetical protein